jgi:hypothetical protein
LVDLLIHLPLLTMAYQVSPPARLTGLNRDCVMEINDDRSNPNIGTRCTQEACMALAQPGVRAFCWQSSIHGIG